MEVGNLWLIPASILFNSWLYWVQKRYLVKWFCRRFLSNSVQLECDLPSQKSNVSDGKKLVSEGDVKGIAMENVGSLMGSFAATMSVIVMVQAGHDVVYGRSPFLIPLMHIGSWYLVVDLYNMYDAFRTKNDLSHLPTHSRILKFMRSKWPYVIHHVVLFTVAYTVIVNESVRGCKGDFAAATITIEDFSNPLVNSAKVLKMLGRDKTTLYIVNGALLVVVFFIVRILNIPFFFLLYSSQYHNWSIIASLEKLQVVCWIAIILQYMLQIYWFTLIVKLALRSVVAKIKGQPKTQTVNRKKTN